MLSLTQPRHSPPPLTQPEKTTYPLALQPLVFNTSGAPTNEQSLRAVTDALKDKSCDDHITATIFEHAFDNNYQEYLNTLIKGIGKEGYGAVTINENVKRILAEKGITLSQNTGGITMHGESLIYDERRYPAIDSTLAELSVPQVVTRIIYDYDGPAMLKICTGNKPAIHKKLNSNDREEQREIFEAASCQGKIRDLNKMPLPCMDLSNINLSGLNLTKLRLERANLYNADLQGTNLTKARFDNVNLSNAFLYKAIFKSAKISHSSMTNAILTDTNLEGAEFVHVDFSGAQLQFAQMQHTEMRFVKLAGANLTLANLSHAEISISDLTDVVLKETTLNSVTMKEVMVDKQTKKALPLLVQWQSTFVDIAPEIHLKNMPLLKK